MPDLNRLVDEIRNSKKYRELQIPPDTIRDLLEQELPRHRNDKDAVKSVRQKLHNIIAPYLGDPDYPVATASLTDAFSSGSPAQIEAVCLSLLASHASTRERVPHQQEFFSAIWQITGQPRTLLDLACGMNPFAFAWMNLPIDVEYHACDLHQPRINLIQHYFKLQGLNPYTTCDDILVNPPRQSADVAFFFKEAHRFEQRQRGCNRPFWQALNVRWLVVSLPASDLAGHHSLANQHRALVYNNLQGFNWPVIEAQVGNELIFCIHKAPQQ